MRVGSENPGAPMKLCCPKCGKRHIDKGEWATKPHRTHMCQYCLFLWMPEEFNTVGVVEE